MEYWQNQHDEECLFSWTGKYIHQKYVCPGFCPASGMCEAGRIRHHLKHNLWRENSTILFVGYQAVGTLGRAILEGATTVKLFGEEIAVKARIESLKGISGHGDQKELVKWLEAMKKRPQKLRS